MVSTEEEATAVRGEQQVNETEGICHFLRRAVEPRQPDNLLDNTPVVVKQSSTTGALWAGCEPSV